MELTHRETTIVFNALGRLHDLSMDGFYNYHRDDEILELQNKFYELIKTKKLSE